MASRKSKISPQRYAREVRDTQEWQRKDAANITRRATRKNGKIPANVVLTFVSENPEYLPSHENYGGYLTEEEIVRVRLILWDTKARRARFVALTKAQNVTNISEATLVSLMAASVQKKYRERSSPPFSAADLCGTTLKGNDGAMYSAVKNAAGVCAWKPML